MTSEPDGDDEEPTGQALVARELRRYRELAGLSRNQLATRVGYSRTYISTCEKPGAALVSEAVVRRIDAELGAGGALVRVQAQAAAERHRRRDAAGGHERADPASLTTSVDRCALPVSTSVGGSWNSGAGEVSAVVPAIRRAMQEVSFAHTSITVPVSPDDLERRISRAWRLWHFSPTQRTDVGVLLPDLIRDAHDSVRANELFERRRAQAATGDLYRLVQRLLAHIAEPELHALAVERGRAMSEAADMPSALALAAWSSAIAVSAQGYFDEAVRIADAGSQLMQPAVEAGDPEALGLLGALQLESAAAMGFAGCGDLTCGYLATAWSAAERLPAGQWHPQSGFDRTGAAVMSMIVDVARGDTAGAIQRAEQIDPATIPSRVRRSRFLLELAVAYMRRREPFAAVHYLGLAVAESREAVTPIPWATDLAHELVEMAPPTLRNEASALAARFASPLSA